MANLMTKTRYVNIVVRKDSIFNIMAYDKKIHQWCCENCELFCYIYHEQDINIYGEIENCHLHLVCTMLSVKRLCTTLTSFCSFLEITTTGVMIDKVNSYEGSLQYLLHKNDPQKTQHVFAELHHNYKDDDLHAILETSSDNLTAERLYSIVKDAKCNYDIIKAIGLNRYHNLRNVIRDLREDVRIQRFKNRFYDTDLNDENNHKEEKSTIPIIY